MNKKKKKNVSYWSLLEMFDDKVKMYEKIIYLNSKCKALV